VSQKKKPKKNLQFTCWRKDRHGVYQPYCRYRGFEVKMSEYNFDEVLKLLPGLKQMYALKIHKETYGLEQLPEDTLFSEFAEKWLIYKLKKIKPNTVRIYENILKNHILPIFEDLLLVEITREDIEKLIDKVYSEKKTRLSQLVYYVLSNLFKWAVDKNYLDKNPFYKINLPKHKAKEIEVLTVAEAKIFLEKIKTSKHSLLFELALMSGMRPEEYFALRWKDIDFAHKTISVRIALNLGMPETVDFHNLKSERNSYRKIPLAENLIEKLRKLHKTEKKKKYQFNYNLVFCCENGKPLRLNNLTNRHFKPIIREIDKLKDLSLYSLRHTCATLLMLAGENPKVVAERLGNSVEVTLKTYSHVSPNMQKSASEKLEKMFG
jgi:integrase